MPKRAALLFDQLMVALQKVVDNQGKSAVRGDRFAADPETVPAMEDEQTVANSVLTFKYLYLRELERFCI